MTINVAAYEMWRRRKRRDVFPEAAAIIRPTVRFWLWAFFLRPIATARYANLLFRRWACLPGDTFQDLAMDCRYIVKRPTRRYIEAWRTPGEWINCDGSRPPTLARIPRSETYRWTLLRS